MSGDMIMHRLETHLTHLRAVYADLFNLAIGDDSDYAKREGELASEIAKLICHLEISIASAKRYMKDERPDPPTPVPSEYPPSATRL